MQKGVAGQRIGVQMVSSSDGSAFTGTVTVYVTGDAGSQAIGSVGSGVCTHEGNGYHSYAPAQAETNYDLIAFTFTGSGAVPVTVQVYTAINPVTAVPTAAANATAVRSELTTELGRIDVATSTRLASASYSAAPSAATVADAVWDEATVDHTSIGSFGYVIGIFFSLIEFVTGWRFTAKAVELAGGNVTVTPLAATDIQRVIGTTITVFLKENITIGPIAVTDVNNDNVDLSAPCELIISQKYRGDVIVIADGSITRSGVDNHQFSFSSSGATLIPGTFAWSLRRVSDNYVFAHGDWIVKQTAVKD